jgi:hypothetical protein
MGLYFEGAIIQPTRETFPTESECSEKGEVQNSRGSAKIQDNNMGNISNQINTLVQYF